MTAEDRELLAGLGRLPAYAAVADVPGLNAFGLVTGGGGYKPSAQAEAFVHGQQRKLVQRYGAKGRQILADLQDYADGITAYRRSKNPAAEAWTVDDCIAVTAFIGSIFGNGGGSEVRNDDFLARLRGRLGAKRGGQAFADLMEANDPEAPTTVAKRFRYGVSGPKPTKGSPLVQARHRPTRAARPPSRSAWRRTSSWSARTARPRASRWPSWAPSWATTTRRSSSRPTCTAPASTRRARSPRAAAPTS